MWGVASAGKIWVQVRVFYPWPGCPQQGCQLAGPGGKQPPNQHFVLLDLWAKIFRDLSLTPIQGIQFSEGSFGGEL